MATDKDKNSRSYLLTLTLAALGVVYGDIGTSPLYAVKECFNELNGITVNQANIFGIISLIFWSLILVISFKYLLFIMRADNEGEGGILALMEAVENHFNKRKKLIIITLGLFGAALLYGDGIITPAISVLSAVEGLKVATPVFKPYIIPITVAILFVLFYFQKKGTAGVGKYFGPIMMLWFATLGTLGVISIVRSPEILSALSPTYAWKFFAIHSWRGVLVLGAVFLVVTGGEALYADLGHFSLKSIRLGWFGLVLPGLMLNYLGQGALLLRNPGAVDNPFYRLPPEWALYPMVVLSTIATVIASQAVISGVFSLTYQAVNLHYFPKLRILHTSPEEKGQVYLPGMNWMLFAATIALVFGFRSSSALAGAYGVAVSTTMVITSLLAFAAMLKLWKWNLFAALGLTLFFLAIDFSFFSANMFKIDDGGWLPLVVAAFVYLIMTTWSKGRRIIGNILRENEDPLEESVEDMEWSKEERIDGTAIYLATSVERLPNSLKLNYQYNRVLHECVIILSYQYARVPYVTYDHMLQVEEINGHFYKAVVRVGFKDNVSIRRLIPKLNEKIEEFDAEKLTFIIGTKHLLPADNVEMHKWRKSLFVFLQMNDLHATSHFNLPESQVIEIGSQIKF